MNQDSIKKNKQQIIEFFSYDENEKLQLWRIESLKTVKQKVASLQQFHIGDSYILLFQDKSKEISLIHFWMGEESSADEFTAAAILSVQLDQALDIDSTIYREVQNNESKQFLTYFPLGIKYEQGGFNSAFKKHEVEQSIAKLYHIKGKNQVRCNQVACKFSSINEGDAFVLDIEKTIMIWLGKQVNVFEKNKASYVATQIKYNEKPKGADILTVNTDKILLEKFYSYLEGDESQIGQAKDDDKDYEQKSKAVRLFQIKDDQCEEIKERPLKKEMLVSDDSFIVVSVDTVYIWNGNGSHQQEISNCFNIALKLLKQQQLKSNCSMISIKEGQENNHVMFRQLFIGYDNLQKKIQKEEKYQEVVNNVQLNQIKVKRQDQYLKQLETITNVKVKQYLLKDKELVQLDEQDKGMFFDHECYLIELLYKQDNRKHRVLYYWLGVHRTQIQQTNIAYKLQQMSVQGLNTTQVRVPMLQEPIEFFTLLFPDQIFIIKQGCYINYAQLKKMLSTNTFLFKINSQDFISTKVVQISLDCSSLNSNDAFVLFHQNQSYLWQGKGCSQLEAQVAKKLINQFSVINNIITIQEDNNNNKDLENFYKFLGGYKQYSKETNEQIAQIDPILYVGGVRKNEFVIDKCMNFSQMDLLQDDIAILDAYSQIYVWVGSSSDKEEQKQALEAVKRLLINDQYKRTIDNTCVNIVYSGNESIQFISHFNAWDYQLALLQAHQEIITNQQQQITQSKQFKKQLSNVLNITESESKTIYQDFSIKLPYSQLKDQFPDNIDPTQKQNYLTDEEFQSVFKMNINEFNELKQWRQNKLKKEVGLF